MKNNRTYLSLAGLLFVVVLVTMLWQYPRVHNRYTYKGTLTMFDYRAENERCVLKTTSAKQHRIVEVPR